MFVYSDRSEATLPVHRTSVEYERMEPDATDGFAELILKFGADCRTLMYRYHHELTDKFGPNKGQMSMYDPYMAGVLRRSYALTRGFFDLTASRNFTAAAPLVRLQ